MIQKKMYFIFCSCSYYSNVFHVKKTHLHVAFYVRCALFKFMALLHAFCFVNPQPARDTSIGLSTHWVHRDEEKPVFHGEFPECRWKQTNQVIEVFYILILIHTVDIKFMYV